MKRHEKELKRLAETLGQLPGKELLDRKLCEIHTLMTKAMMAEGRQVDYAALDKAEQLMDDLRNCIYNVRSNARSEGQP